MNLHLFNKNAKDIENNMKKHVQTGTKQQPMKSTLMTHDPKFGYLEYLASPKNII